MSTNKTKRSLKDYSILVVKGFFMGIAEIIPGVSGGTIAFLLGIYEEFISAIKSVNLEFVQLLFRFKLKEAFKVVNWSFLLSLGFGMVVAILSLSKLLKWLLADYPVYPHSFFYGLILATGPIIFSILKKKTITTWFTIAVSLLITYKIVSLVPIQTPESLWFIFFCAAIAISAMILPGISGAFILLLLGKYEFIITAIHDRNLIVVGVFLLGIAVGITSFVRVLSWLFTKYHDQTIAVITGVVFGSLSKIWPWKKTLESVTLSNGKVYPIKVSNILPETFNQEVIIAISFIIIGFFIAIALNSSKKTNGQILNSNNS
jgi:putative membrane protein